MVLNIISINVRGLRNAQKRRIIFEYYRKRCHVLCIQESHSVKEDESIWQAEWGGRAYFCHRTSNARGVITLVHRKITDKITVTDRCNDGRMLQVKINHNDNDVCVTNIYAPNNDAPGFFEKHINNAHLACSKNIIIGDFNVTLNPSIDRKNTAEENHTMAMAKLHKLQDELCLEDVWRVQNPNVQRYSWYRISTIAKNEVKISASRIDFALISRGMCSDIHTCMYLNGVKTDHSAFFIGYDAEKTKRGSSYWKMNTSILCDVNKVCEVRKHIVELERQLSKLQPAEKWETFKKQIRTYLKNMAKRTASEDQLAISQLTEKVIEMECQLEVMTQQQTEILTRSKQDLELLLQKKIIGTMFRSKVQWNNEGEHHTKYFFNLECTRYSAKTSTCLLNELGQPVRNQDKIIDMQREFYQDLYQKDNRVSFEIDNIAVTTVDDSMTASHEVQFSEGEIYKAIRDLKNNSCPGGDGLPVEFYKTFWPEIKGMVMAMITSVYEDGSLHQSARSGVLNLIPKGSKDPRLLKNLRPISLLNCDYKIIEKAIANRMVPALQEVIHNDQKGFLPERRISANIRKVIDVMMAAQEHEEQWCLLSCDFLKCFNRIETDSVLKSMEIFKFSKVLQKWVAILYADFTLRVQNDGHFSDPIYVSCSIRQGGPASNALFLIVAEILAILLRTDKDIQGVNIRGLLHLLNQFADDLSICTPFNEKSMAKILQNFKYFHQNTGFLLSYEKTTVYRMGSLKNSKAVLYTGRELTWTNEPVNVLGVMVCNDQEHMCKINYEQAVVKAENIMQKWEHQNLSLKGKVLIVNTLVASLFTYKMQVLPTIPQRYVKRLDEAVKKFVWNNHRPKIPMATLQNTKEEGGLQLVNFEIKDASLKASWIKIVMDGQYDADLVFEIIHPIGPMLWSCNLHQKHVEACIRTNNQFWNDVMRAWCTYHFCAETPEGVEDHVIWLNSRILCQNTPIWWPKQAAKGLMFVSQIYGPDGFISEESAKSQYNLTVMKYNTLKVSISPEMKKEIGENPTFTDPRYAQLSKQKSPSSFVYKQICPADPSVTTRINKLESEISQCVNMEAEIEWMNQLTVIQKYRSFQYRMLMSAITTNIQLKKWGIKQEDDCTFCEKERETVKHLFYGCPEVQVVWDTTTGIAKSLIPNSEWDHSYANIMLCRVSESRAINLVCLTVKQYIYMKRCKKQRLNKDEVYTMIVKVKNMEKYQAVKNGKISKYLNKWEPCSPLTTM